MRTSRPRHWIIPQRGDLSGATARVDCHTTFEVSDVRNTHPRTRQHPRRVVADPSGQVPFLSGADLISLPSRGTSLRRALRGCPRPARDSIGTFRRSSSWRPVLLALAAIDLERLILPKSIIYWTLAFLSASLLVAAGATGQWHRLLIAALCARWLVRALLRDELHQSARPRVR
jgi:hypothetical protein